MQTAFDLHIEDNGSSLINVGSRASVTVHTGDHASFNALDRFLIRIRSYLSYAC